MCMRDHLFRNNEGWRRTLIIFEKNSAQDRLIMITSLLRFMYFPSTPFIKNGFLRKTILNLVEKNADHNYESSCNSPRNSAWVFWKSKSTGGAEWCCLNRVLIKKTSSIFAGPRVDKSGLGPNLLTIFSPKVEQIILR